MRRVRDNVRSWVFALNGRERDFLVTVLKAYPSLPPDYHSLSRESADRLSPEDAALLHESLQEHRTASKARLRRWLQAGTRFRREGDEWRFSLAKTDFNWMIQVLNDVRVGNWLRLGSPEDIHNPIDLLQKDPVALFHMEAAGLFQMQFLEATQGGQGES